MKFHAKGTLSRILDRDNAVFEECNRLIDDFNDDISVCPAFNSAFMFS